MVSSTFHLPKAPQRPEPVGALLQYEADSAPALALNATIERTEKRFAKYANQNLLCGSDGLPHLISDPGLALRFGHAGETLVRTSAALCDHQPRQHACSRDSLQAWSSAPLCCPVHGCRERCICQIMLQQLISHHDQATLQHCTGPSITPASTISPHSGSLFCAARQARCCPQWTLTLQPLLSHVSVANPHREFSNL